MNESTMKAAVLKEFGSPLSVESVAMPQTGTGEVVVDVRASRVLAYSSDVFSGERQYLLELPVIPGPGAVGKIREVGPDATRLAVGDWVYCNPTICSRDSKDDPDITAGLERTWRGRPAFAEVLWQWRLGRADARAH